MHHWAILYIHVDKLYRSRLMNTYQIRDETYLLENHLQQPICAAVLAFSDISIDHRHSKLIMVALAGECGQGWMVFSKMKLCSPTYLSVKQFAHYWPWVKGATNEQVYTVSFIRSHYPHLNSYEHYDVYIGYESIVILSYFCRICLFYVDC